MRSELLRGFTLGTQSLWFFLQKVAAGLQSTTALSQVLPQWAAANGRRLWARFRTSQSRIREQLLKLVAPPACDSPEPALQTIAHLRAAFPTTGCPLSAYQAHFQADVFT